MGNKAMLTLLPFCARCKQFLANKFKFSPIIFFLILILKENEIPFIGSENVKPEIAVEPSKKFRIYSK